MANRKVRVGPRGRWKRFLAGLSSVPGERALQNWLLVVASILITSWLVLGALVMWALSVNPLPPGASVSYDTIPFFGLLRTVMRLSLTCLALWLVVLAARHRGELREVQGLKWRWIVAPLMLSVLMAVYQPWAAWMVILVAVLVAATTRRVPRAERTISVEGGTLG